MNVLKGPTRTYLLNNCAQVMAYGQLIELLKRECDSDSRQLQIHSTLEYLNLDAFMFVRCPTTHSNGLTKLVEHLEQLTPQCSPGFRSDEDKIRFLVKSVLSFEWSLNHIRNIVSHCYKFHLFVTDLHESLQPTKELKGARPPVCPTCIAEMDEEQAADVFFQRYGRNPRHVQNPISNLPPGRLYRPRFPPSSRTPPDCNEVRHGRTFDEARRRKECVKCAAPWQPPHRCNAGAIASRARSRLRNDESHVHIIRDYILEMEGEQEPRQSAVCPWKEGKNAAGNKLYDALYHALDISDHTPYYTNTVDGDVVTDVVSASVSEQMPSACFRKGDVDNSLILIAHIVRPTNIGLRPSPQTSGC